MGHKRHHAIIVTSWNWDLLTAAHAEATRLFPAITSIVESEINGFRSFLIPPDGSFEGWEESDDGDRRRRQFRAWLQAQRYEDGSSPFDWVEIQYADDKGRNRILYHDAQRRMEEEPHG